MFSLYAALVKNLRGVVVFHEYENAKKGIDWLRKRFRYRDLGLPPSLAEKYRNVLRDYMDGDPFRELYYPTPLYQRLVELLAGVLGDTILAEAIVMASLYISPLLVLEEKLVDILEKHSVEKILVDKELNINDWKLHLRIADYTILDMYSKVVVRGLDLIECYKNRDRDCVEEILRERTEIIKRDTKRYWRIKSSSGWVFLLYIDPFKILYEAGAEPDKLEKDYAAGLSIIPIVNIRV